MTAILSRGRVCRPSGDPGDPLDWLLTVTQGEVLRLPDADGVGGEYDSLRQYSARDRRRLAGAGLVGRGRGASADVLLHSVQESYCCPTELVAANPDEFVTWFVDTALAGLDHRQCGTVPVEPEPELVPAVVVGTVWPVWLEQWCERTVYGPKAELLGLLGAAAYMGAPWPAIPAKEWASKMVGKFERRSGLVVGGTVR